MVIKMANYARVINNIAVDVSTDPFNSFVPELANEFIPVPDFVKPGYVLINDEWKEPIPVPKPEPQPEPTPSYPIVTPIQFKLLFTSQERVAIDEAKSTSPIIKDFFSLIDDPRLSEVDFNLKSVRDMIDELARLELIAPSRVEQIISATPV